MMCVYDRANRRYNYRSLGLEPREIRTFITLMPLFASAVRFHATGSIAMMNMPAEGQLAFSTLPVSESAPAPQRRP
jgi:hypothetical protein